MQVRVKHRPEALTEAQFQVVGRVIQAALQAVDPYEAVKNCMDLHDGVLSISGSRYPLHELSRILVCGFGKASLEMAAAAEDILGDHIHGGVVIYKHETRQTRLRRIKTLRGAHPVPDENSLSAAKALLGRTTGLTDQDMVIILVSGGGSSLFSLPADGISLEDLQSANHALLACGASIHEMNAIRKHIDTVKGGGLWRHLQPASTAAIIMSDVVGDDLDVIASGPLTPDSTTFTDTLEVVRKYRLEKVLPPSVLNRLHSGSLGKVADTLKSDVYTKENSQVVLAGSNRLAALAAVAQSKAEGYLSELVTSELVGEARLAGQSLAERGGRLRSTLLPGDQPACQVFGGETTVTLSGGGCGGRNLETALAAVQGLAGVKEIALVTLATDGEDGPTGAAGAVVTGSSMDRASHFGMDSQKFLENHDSYAYFERLNDLIITGPTGTNVNDLSFVFAF